VTGIVDTIVPESCTPDDFSRYSGPGTLFILLPACGGSYQAPRLTKRSAPKQLAQAPLKRPKFRSSLRDKKYTSLADAQKAVDEETSSPPLEDFQMSGEDSETQRTVPEGMDETIIDEDQPRRDALLYRQPAPKTRFPPIEPALHFFDDANCDPETDSILIPDTWHPGTDSLPLPLLTEAVPQDTEVEDGASPEDNLKVPGAASEPDSNPPQPEASEEARRKQQKGFIKVEDRALHATPPSVLSGRAASRSVKNRQRLRIHVALAVLNELESRKK